MAGVTLGSRTGSDTALVDHGEDVLHSAKYLSPFQVEKYKYIFKAFFDHDKNGLIEKIDIDKFEDRMQVYTGWAKDSVENLSMRDVLATFYECIKDQVKLEMKAEEGTAEEAMISWEDAFAKYTYTDISQVNLTHWLNMWGRLCYGSAGISDFPIWVQLLPDLFFEVIDTDGDGILSSQEIKNFYKGVIGIGDANLEKVAKEGYRAMTANEEYKLDKKNYLFCFANFLLGKGIYGPGKYLFGVFDNREIDESYVVSYNEGDDNY